MLFDTRFDLVVSIGEDCACTSYLRRCMLQEFSYPFDWLTKAPFANRIELILNDFSDFLKKEDLYQLEKPKNGDVDKKCDYWADKKYDFYFYHDFRVGEPFDDEYTKVKEKYARRIKRFYEQILNSKNVLFVWWSRNKHQNLDTINDYYVKLSQKFPNNSIYLLLIEYRENEEKIFLANKHVIISRYDNISFEHNKNWNETTGNEINNLEIFSQIKMNRSLHWRIKYLFYCILKIFIEIIPFKSIKRKLKRKLKTKFYKVAL